MLGRFLSLWRRLWGEDPDRQANSPPSVTESTPPASPVPAKPPKPELQTSILGSEPGNQLALLTVSGKLRDAMLARYREHWANSGSPVSNGGKMSPAAILSVIGAAGGTAGLGAAMSGQLFIATANPATLMAIQGGVGSAVVGARGSIIGQAPFIAASTAIVPVIGPLLVFQAISTFLVMKHFQSIRGDLARIEVALERVLHRTEATFAAELVAISQRLESLEEQFSDQREFSTDMIVRLALAEERVTALCERYKLLHGSQGIAVHSSEADLDFKIHDSRLAVIASSMALRIGYLRLALSLQEFPARAGRLVEHFLASCDHHDSLLKAIKMEGEKTNTLVDELDSAVRAMSWYKSTMPRLLGGSRSKRVDSERASEKLRRHQERQREVDHQDVSVAEDLGTLARRAVGGSVGLALVYWKDAFGEHSYYVEDLPYEIVGAETSSEERSAGTPTR
jgi:hypothetical protein